MVRVESVSTRRELSLFRNFVGLGRWNHLVRARTYTLQEYHGMRFPTLFRDGLWWLGGGTRLVVHVVCLNVYLTSAHCNRLVPARTFREQTVPGCD